MASVLLLIGLSGCEADGRFKLNSSLVGTFATARATVKETGKHYAIDIVIHTQGIYNFVKGKRTEHYRSVGSIRKGLYVSDKLIIERWTKTLHSINQYTLNHKTRKIIRHYREWHGKKLAKESKVTMDHFGNDDFLTIVHNALKLAPKRATTRKTYIVAASEETHGKVPVYISHDARLLKRWGGDTHGTLFQMGISKSVFEHGKGSMTILLDSKGKPTRFFIKPIKMGGTITGIPTR